MSADYADVGGELHVSRPGVRAILGAEQRADGRWVGYHDMLIGQTAAAEEPARWPPAPTRSPAPPTRSRSSATRALPQRQRAKGAATAAR